MLRLVSLGLVCAASAFGANRHASANDEQKALALVQLYYSLQGSPDQPDDVMEAGTAAAIEFYADGLSGAELVDLVVRAHQEIPGTKDQPFEAVMPPYIRGHALLADAGLDDYSRTAAPTPEASSTGAAPARPLNTNLSASAQIGTDRLPGVNPRPGVVVAGVMDLVGTVLYLVGVLTIAEPGVPSGLLMGIGGVFFSTGAIIGNVNLSVYQGIAMRRGASPETKWGAGAWILGGITISATIGAFALGAAAAEGSDDLLALAIGSIILTSTAFGCEIANLVSVRSKWLHAIDTSLVAQRSGPVRPTLRPIVFASRDPNTGGLVPMAGIGGTF